MKAPLILTLLATMAISCSCTKETDTPASSRGPCSEPDVAAVLFDTNAFADTAQWTGVAINSVEVCGDVLIAQVSYTVDSNPIPHVLSILTDGYTIRTAPPKRRLRIVDLDAPVTPTGILSQPVVFDLHDLRVPSVNQVILLLPDTAVAYTY